MVGGKVMIPAASVTSPSLIRNWEKTPRNPNASLQLTPDGSELRRQLPSGPDMREVPCPRGLLWLDCIGPISTRYCFYKLRPIGVASSCGNLVWDFGGVKYYSIDARVGMRIEVGAETLRFQSANKRASSATVAGDGSLVLVESTADL